MNSRFFALLFSIFAVLSSARANPITYDLSGVLTSVDVLNVSNFGMHVGSTFTGTMTWEYFDGSTGSTFVGAPIPDPHQAPDAPFHLDGWFHVEINVGGQIMQTGKGGEYAARSWNNTATGDEMKFSSRGDDTELTPWGSVADTNFNMDFMDYSGSAVNSSLLPANFNLAQWQNEHLFNFEGDGGFGSPYFNVVGNITSVVAEPTTRVPDDGNTAFLLGSVFALAVMMNNGRRSTALKAPSA